MRKAQLSTFDELVKHGYEFRDAVFLYRCLLGHNGPRHVCHEQDENEKITQPKRRAHNRYNFSPRRRSAFTITENELRLIAALAIIGLRSTG